jgi:hypothetical protein
MGVFASRSPFRPNSIGLSCVKLISIDETEENGIVLTVSGADLLDGTPIIDIKPYLPYVDAHPEASGGFALQEKEGSLAKRFVALTREETLADVAHLWHLNKLVKTTDKELRENNSVLSDVCEAILGALYLDQGLQAVKDLVLPVWTPLMESNIQAPQDPKSACQEWAQKKFKCLPVYTTLDQMGTEHNPVFKVQIKVADLTAFGVGHNKKEAEKDAAQNLLEQYHD